jgi:hypothetical protein
MVGGAEAEGFRTLIDAKRPELTAEYLVVKHAPLFAPDIVNRARTRLIAHHVVLPDSLL